MVNPNEIEDLRARLAEVEASEERLASACGSLLAIVGFQSPAWGVAGLWIHEARTEAKMALAARPKKQIAR
jgi:hypothetical protein